MTNKLKSLISLFDMNGNAGRIEPTPPGLKIPVTAVDGGEREAVQDWNVFHSHSAIGRKPFCCRIRSR